jgi:hypothetical protein
MYTQYSSMSRILLNDGRVTDLVDDSNIKIGYVKDEIKYPTISLYRSEGSSRGKLGYKTSTKGSRDREIQCGFVIDIYHRDSVEDVEKIDDAVQKALHSGSSTGVGLQMTGNPSIWDDTHNAYRVSQTWLYNEILSD